LYERETMGRRRKSSTADDLMDLVALLPWWGGVGLAAVSYWVLHAVATRPLPTVQTGKQLSEALPSMLWQGFATGGQYLIPFICLLGALASFMRRRKRNALFDTASQTSGADALQGMSWQEFEMLVGEGFKRRGYGVRETGGGGADGGVDLVLTKGGERFFVQCKQWRAFKVGVSTARELYGVMAAEGASGGFVVTSGRFTKDAEAFAAGRNIRLIDGVELVQLLQDGRMGQAGDARAPEPRTPSNGAGDVGRRTPTTRRQATAPHEPPNEPACPRCTKPMVRRIAKRGEAAGRAFWGCSAYSTGCRGTREI
jgi:restriction system protein